MGGTVRGGEGRGRVGGRWGGDREGVEGRTGREGMKQRRSKEREGGKGVSLGERQTR